MLVTGYLGRYVSGIFTTILFIFFIVPTISLSNNTHQISVKTNLEVMQLLIAEISQELVDRLQIRQGDSVLIKYGEDNNMWIVQNVFTSTLKKKDYHVFSNDSTGIISNFQIDVVNFDLQVSYDGMFRDGLFGMKKVKRTVSASLSCQATNTLTSEILYSGSNTKQFTDTVSLDDINKIESQSINSTKAKLPSEPFLDRIVEPFVIIGVTGLTIYLFFQVRS